MATVAEALQQNRAAVEEFLATAAGSAAPWTAPRAPAKWSPSQVAEHVARARLQGALAVLEAASSARGPDEQVVDATTFGAVSLTDYLIFQAHHTRHHRPQLEAPQ